jgi:SAM-dependent methyltransferase
VNLDPDSLERVVPDYIRAEETTGQESLALHIARYEFAAQHLRPQRLLDIACGVGYGTFLLAERRPELVAIGVDISEAAIAYARSRYIHERAQFIVADANTFTDPEGFDSIVSLETIEHLNNPERFIAHIVGQLRPGGVFVASVPTTPTTDANPHHVNDFTERSFRRILQRQGLKEIAAFGQVQPFKRLSVLSEARARNLRKNLPLFYLQHPVSIARRIYATVRYGYENHYLTIAARK